MKVISEAIKAAFTRVLIQKCVVHQIRNSCKFANYNNLTQFTKDMKKIYSSKNVVEAEKQLEISKKIEELNIHMQLNHEEKTFKN
ncbi:MAG: transposase [Mycoplasma sp.]